MVVLAALLAAVMLGGCGGSKTPSIDEGMAAVAASIMWGRCNVLIRRWWTEKICGFYIEDRGLLIWG